MAKALIIYVKDANQQKELMKNHPGVDADWIDLAGQTKGMEDLLPMVCATNNKGEEVCEVGENYIEQFSKRR